MKPIIEISILWFIIYHLLILLFASSRARQVFRGILILVLLYLVAQVAELTTVSWLLNKLFAISVIAALIIFHPEIRQGFAKLGQQHFFAINIPEEDTDVILKEITKATDILCRKKIGALIAIENRESLSAYAENGVELDAKISAELIEAIFSPNNILHDGGIIIQQNRIRAAGCIFPLPENTDISRIFGTRHRAALGLSNETDAVVIIVSEERGDVSLVFQGKLYKDLSREELFQKIKSFLKY
ncbi:MAG: diadenylate cyclase CdaA [Candidatus Omnitrophica bacterium]|nr:diadenylate cyclase CdaA [Candidatus Omnitrophota bacterium]